MRPLRFVSMFYYGAADGQMTTGLTVGAVPALLGVASIAVGAAAVTVDRLDIP